MAFATEKAMAQAATAEKDAVAYIDCIFHRRYAEHLPLTLVLQDMTQLRNRNVLGYVGAMSFCQRAFLQTRSHLYRIYNDEIYICPKDYRDAVANLIDYVIARPKTSLADLYSYCSAAHPALIKGEIGTGLTVFRRFIEEHPTIFEIVEPAPKEMDKQEITNHAQVYAGVLLFPKIKIAVGRVVNISGNTAYLECQGEFVAFHAVSANLPSTAQLKTYITKGDMVPFEARYYPDTTAMNGSGSASVVLAAAGVSSTKLRNVWRAVNVELPRNASPRHGSSATTIITTAAVESALTSPRSPQKSPFESPVRRAGSASSHRPSTTTADSFSTNSYMAPLDDATEWAPVNSPDRRRSSVQKRDSSVSGSAAPSSVSIAVRRTGSSAGAAGGRSTPPFPAANLSRHFNPFQVDAGTQAGSGRPNIDKEVQTEVTDEEIMLKLIRKYPNLLDNVKQ